jgi:hypothetical protein
LFAGGPLTFLPALKDSFVKTLKLVPGDWLEIERGELLSARGAALAAAGRGPVFPLSQWIDRLQSSSSAQVAEGRLEPLFPVDRERHVEMARRRYSDEHVDVQS